MKYLFVTIVSILLLIAALINLPYGFYTFLRFVVFIFCIYCVYHLREIYKNKINFFILPILVAILYNPIIRVHLDKESWTVINLITIVLIWYPYILKDFRDKISQ